MTERNIVLGYHDSLLRSADVKLLEKKQWLNDILIGFIYEYYEYDKYKEHNKDLLFVNPSFVQIIKFSTAEELHGMLEEWFEKKLIFIPINNNNEQLIAGGTHWSLLVLYPKEKTCIHLDSAGDCNRGSAHMVYNKVKQVFQASMQTLHYQETLSPQQCNAYDCGVHVISNTELVCEHFLHNKGIIQNSDLMETVGTDMATEKRNEMKQLILKLSNDPPSQ